MMSFLRKLYYTFRYLFSFLPFQTKSFTLVCFYVGILCLTLQFFIFLILLYTLDGGVISSSAILSKKCSVDIQEDFKTLSSLSFDLGFNLILLDKEIIKEETNQNTSKKLIYCTLCKPILMAVDNAFLLDLRKQLLSKLIDHGFVPVTFYNSHPLQRIPELNHIETVIFVQRTATFQIIIFHPREDNTWWFGDIHSDTSYEVKLASLNLTLQEIDLMKTEGAVEKFEMVPTSLSEESSMIQPKDVSTVLSDIKNSKFIECNLTRATLFHDKFGSDKSPEAIRFRHKVWKMLSRVKTILDSLGIVFWLSSGTALGYFRECDIIAHSKDVDIGIWASSYSDRIITEMHDHGFHLKISLGFPNDSLELSFIDQSGIKLDIFFFYKEDNNHYWNGGTQVKSGKKFKYTFPKFTLCWTIFKDLRVRVPCEMEAYIRANYGPNWFTPVKTWDWKTSPANVLPNGVWKQEQLADAIKLFV
uniref:Ribitol-5-phosphate transferase FKTN N-terminal domain-containing protein n=1 Tax=Cuerna arida TaxID=1464854 RepID=A0A1B6H1C7_9HEMI